MPPHPRPMRVELHSRRIWLDDAVVDHLLTAMLLADLTVFATEDT